MAIVSDPLWFPRITHHYSLSDHRPLHLNVLVLPYGPHGRQTYDKFHRSLSRMAQQPVLKSLRLISGEGAGTNSLIWGHFNYARSLGSALEALELIGSEDEFGHEDGSLTPVTSFRDILHYPSQHIRYLSFHSVCFDGYINFELFPLQVEFPELQELRLIKVDAVAISIISLIKAPKLEVLAIECLPQSVVVPMITLESNSYANLRHLVIHSAKPALILFNITKNFTSLSTTMDTFDMVDRSALELNPSALTPLWSNLRSLTVLPAVARGQRSMSQQDADFVRNVHGAINSGPTIKVLEIGPLDDDVVLNGEKWRALKEQVKVVRMSEKDIQVERILERMKERAVLEVAT